MTSLDALTSEWMRHDPHPPLELLARIAERFDTVTAVRAIRDVGLVGRLRSYRPHLERFIELRQQSRRLLGREAARA